MSIHRIFLPGAQTQKQLQVSGPEFHHLQVLRMRAGDLVRVADGQGREYSASIAQMEKEGAWVELGQELAVHTEPPLRLTLFQGLARGEKLEWALQKSVEVGIHRFVPVICGRSQVKPDLGGSHQRRWQEIARQAARQSGRTRIPEVGQPMAWETCVKTAAQAPAAFLCTNEYAQARSLKQALTIGRGLNEAALLVGPEGGFTQQEEAAACGAGLLPVRLGPRIFRAETAGVVAAALVLYAWGDLGD